MFYEEITKHVVANATYNIPEGVRVYAIGDIHGNLHLLQKLHALVEADMQNASPQEVVVLYLGDYIDRGAESKQVLAYLLEYPLKADKTIYLRGNHEQRLLDALQDATTMPDWIRVGGDAALLSYGVAIYGKDNASILEDFEEKLPQEHLTFLHKTQLSHVIGNYLFVHAGVNPDIPLDIENLQSQKQDVLRIRKEFLTSDKEFPYKIVFGHSIFKEVTDFGNKVCVDTGAFATGKLSCAIFEGSEIRSLST